MQERFSTSSLFLVLTTHEDALFPHIAISSLRRDSNPQPSVKKRVDESTLTDHGKLRVCCVKRETLTSQP